VVARKPASVSTAGYDDLDLSKSSRLNHFSVYTLAREDSKLQASFFALFCEAFALFAVNFSSKSTYRKGPQRHSS
jgi:hypothetical protein